MWITLRFRIFEFAPVMQVTGNAFLISISLEEDF